MVAARSVRHDDKGGAVAYRRARRVGVYANLAPHDDDCRENTARLPSKGRRRPLLRGDKPSLQYTRNHLCGALTRFTGLFKLGGTREQGSAQSLYFLPPTSSESHSPLSSTEYLRIPLQRTLDPDSTPYSLPSRPPLTLTIALPQVSLAPSARSPSGTASRPSNTLSKTVPRTLPDWKSARSSFQTCGTTSGSFLM